MSDQAEKKNSQGQVYRLVKVGKNADEKASDSVRSNAAESEDEFTSYYSSSRGELVLLAPPYNMKRLDRFSQENNTLAPCIEAMVTNIEGTGYDFGKKDGPTAEDSEDDSNIVKLHDFFDQPWPDTTFLSIRKAVRRDIESVGNAYIEVVRNGKDEIVCLRHVDAKMVRLVRLDNAVPVKRTLKRGGTTQEVRIMMRERRYAQLLNGVTLVYFKEFGSSRDLNKTTGVWEAQGKRIPLKDRATELIHFTCLPDSSTPYGIPRWLSQLPSVMGSRKAEEFNLEYFDNGGIPPILIMLQGGVLQNETRKALEQKMAGSAAQLNRVQILEVEPSGGSIDHPTQARVTVERFGGDRASDSMFEKYDDKCEKRIRRAFRLAPIFLGGAEDYSFASAYVSYTVTEAQVFKPERDEFDNTISMRLLPALGFSEYALQSKPLVIEDVNLKIDGIDLALKTKVVDLEDAIYELNEATGLNLKISDEKMEAESFKTQQSMLPPEQSVQPGNAKPAAAGFGTSTSGSDTGLRTTKSAGVLALAVDTMQSLRDRNFEALANNISLVKSLNESDSRALREALAVLQYTDTSNDVEGLSELAGCTVTAMSTPCCGDTHA